MNQTRKNRELILQPDKEKKMNKTELHNKRNVEIRVEMYQNVQKVSRKRVFGCQRRFECLRVVGRVDGTIPLTHRTFGVILLRHDAF